jgi:hypothetical protein
MALVKGKFVDKDLPIQSNNDPVDPKDLARKSYVDDKAAAEAAAAAADKLPLSGGTMTGILDMDSISIINLADPVNPGDAAHKQYVDDSVVAANGYTDIKIGDLEGNPDVASLVAALANAVFGAKGQPNGFAELDEDGKVPATQLPSYVDDVLEYADLASFPAEGQAGKIYVAQDSNKVYRWSGTVYIEISASPGTTDEVVEGLTNLYFTPERAEAALADELALKQNSLGTGTTSQYLRGDLTWQEIATSVGIAQTKIVSKGGNDATGDGTLSKPYATIAAAMASIADASPTKRYAIKVEAGAYTEGALTLKPNVFVIGDLKEAVRVTATSVAMDATFNQASSIDSRSGMARIILNGACNFDWLAVGSTAGKLYFTEVSFGSAVTMNGGTNAIAQAQFDSCQFFGTLTVSGINVGVFKDNICFGNVTMNQHPNGGMATILNAFGGHIGGTLTLTTTVDNFGRRCSAFLRGMYIENLVVNGVSSYADADLISQGKSVPQLLNGGQLIAMTPRVNHDLETKMLKPLANNSHNNGDWGKQWMFNFAYVHASAGTDMYILSAMENYDPAGDTAGKTIFIQPDAYGLQANANGGNIELETAAVSGTGIRGKVKINARELDMSSKQIKSLADATDAQDAVTKAQLDAAIGGLPGGLSGKKETFTLSAGDIANAYVDCAHLAAADTMLVMSGGVVHVEGESYTLSAVGGVTRITFIGDLVDPSPSKLEAGDKVHVQYLK